MAISTNHLAAQSTMRYYRADRREISFLRFIFEAYDGLAVFETLDPEAGHICFHIAPGCEDDVEMLLEDLKDDIMLEPIMLSRIRCLTRTSRSKRSEDFSMSGNQK